VIPARLTPAQAGALSGLYARSNASKAALLYRIYRQRQLDFHL